MDKQRIELCDVNGCDGEAYPNNAEVYIQDNSHSHVRSMSLCKEHEIEFEVIANNIMGLVGTFLMGKRDE